MTYSQYAFVEAFINEKERAWITAHVHMYEFFGGVTPILVPDNAPTATNRKQSANCATNRTVLRSKTDAERSERTH